jgi:hypothetical protein
MRMLSVATVLVWMAVAAVQAPSAPIGSAPVAEQQVPDWVRYRIFFLHLANLDAFAAQQDAAGIDGDAWRSHDWNAAGLSEEEGAILKEVADRCNRTVREHDIKARTAVAAFRSHLSRGRALSSSPPPELERLRDDRLRIVSSCIERLRSSLPEASFEKLDTYVRTLYHGVVRRSLAPAAAQAPATEQRRSSGGAQ